MRADALEMFLPNGILWMSNVLTDVFGTGQWLR